MASSIFGFKLRDIYSRVVPGALATLIISGPYVFWRYFETDDTVPAYLSSELTIFAPAVLLIWFGVGEGIRYLRRTTGGVPREFREQYQYYHPNTDNSYFTERLLIKLKLDSWSTPNNAWTDQCQFFWDDFPDRFDIDTHKSGHSQVFKILEKDLADGLGENTIRHRSLYELSRNVRMSIILSYTICTLLVIQYYLTDDKLFTYGVLWLFLVSLILVTSAQIYRIVFMSLDPVYVNDLLTEYYIKYVHE